MRMPGPGKKEAAFRRLRDWGRCANGGLRPTLSRHALNYGTTIWSMLPRSWPVLASRIVFVELLFSVTLTFIVVQLVQVPVWANVMFVAVPPLTEIVPVRVVPLEWPLAKRMVIVLVPPPL